MTDWTNPETLTTDELVGFLRNEHETHGVGWGYAGGTSVVGGVYKEAARRLVQAEAALEPVLGCSIEKFLPGHETYAVEPFFTSATLGVEDADGDGIDDESIATALNAVRKAQMVYNGGAK